MPAVSHVDLVVENEAISTTAGTTVGTSSALSNGTPYLVLARGSCCSSSGGVDGISDLLVGGSVYARQRGGAVFAPSGLLATLGHGGVAPMGAAFTYTPSVGTDTIELQASNESGTGEGSWQVYALDLTNIASGTQRWHQEGANSDTIADTPTSGWEVLDSSLTFTAPSAGDYLIFASVEAVPDGTAANTDEIGIRVVVDSTEVSGSRVEMDLQSTDQNDEIFGYLFARVVNLTAASHTISIEGNGTISNGNIGFRRVRLHAIAASAFEDVQQTLDTDGETLSGTVDQELSAGGVTVNPASSEDYLIVGTVQKQASWWAEAYFLRDSTTELPTYAFGSGVDSTGTSAANDMCLETGLYLDAARASSTTYEMRLSKLSGGGDNTYGSACARTGGGDIGIIAIRLATPASGTTYEELAANDSTVTSESADLGIVLEVSASDATGTGEAADLGLAVELAAADATGTLESADLDVEVNLAASDSTGTAESVDLVLVSATELAASDATGTSESASLSAYVELAANDSTGTGEGASLSLSLALAVDDSTGTGEAVDLSTLVDLSTSDSTGTGETVDLDIRGSLDLAAGDSTGTSESASLRKRPAGMQPINEDELRSDFESTILSISPTFPAYREFAWRPVAHPAEVRGGTIRNYYVMIVPPAPDGQLYGSGQSQTGELRVFVCYSGISDEILDGMIPRDGRQIWHAIEARTSPNLDGFMGPSEREFGWVDARQDEDAEGQQWGYFTIRIQYLAPDHAA